MPSGGCTGQTVVFSQEKPLLPGWPWLWPSLCPGKSASATAVVARILKVGVDVSTTDEGPGLEKLGVTSSELQGSRAPH